MKNKLLLLAFFFTQIGALSAKVTLPALVGDNMVLQQQASVKIWGWSKPGAVIKVSTSWGAAESTKADGEGNWIIKLMTPAASFKAYTLTVSDGEPVVLKNVLVGEVWLVSGQSNMEMTFKGLVGSGATNAADAIMESGLYPDIRLFTVARKSAVEPQKDCVGKWEPSSPVVVKSFSSIGYHYALQLHKILKVPVGIINSSWGGTIIEAWMDAESQKAFTDVDLTLLQDEKIPVSQKPISLFNGMIKPLLNYRVRGFLWYQGESNVARYSTYGDKMIAMITLWRNLWGDSNLPFYYAEIAPYNYLTNRLDLTEAQINAALLREKQKQVMDKLSNVGMVFTNDLVYPFERNEIHPANKLAVAKRFSYWALQRTYGFGNAVSVIGPQYKSMKIEGNKAILSFNTSDPGSIGSDGDMVGFEVAGSDRIFYPAIALKANIFPGDISVYSDKVAVPVAVRYCFKNFLLGNVRDAYGQPLVPFRTDDW